MYKGLEEVKIKIKVSRAGKVMSQTVAADIGISTGFVPNKANNTAEFLEDVDKLFDSLNRSLLNLTTNL